MSTLQKSEIDDQEWESKKDLIKKTVCKGSTDDELELFIRVCKNTGLDPFMKQIYALKRKNKQKDGTYKDVMTIQTSIDGFRSIAERTGRYAPGQESKYEYNAEKDLVCATSYIKKLTLDGTWHEVAATAFYDEYVQYGNDNKPGKFWEQMPHVMLSKCAESLALRKAFPMEFSGIYTNEEMTQATAAEEPFKEDARKTIDIKPIERINSEQIEELEDLIVNYPQIKKALYDWLSISKMSELPAAKFSSAKAQIIKNLKEIGDE